MNLQQTGIQHNLTADQITRVTNHLQTVQGQQPEAWMDKMLYVPTAPTSGVLYVDPAWNARVVAALQDPSLGSTPVPPSVSAFQARAVLIQAGLLDGVEAALAADTTDQGRINLARWEYGLTVERASPLVAAVGAALGLTPADIDQMFIDAAQVV